MKVKCMKIYSHYDKKFVKSSPWLTIGKEYIVIAIDILPNEILYRILDNDKQGMSALYKSFQFEIVSGNIPPNWEMLPLGEDSLTLRPAAWKKIGFWEKFYEYDPEAKEIYQRELKIILESEEKITG